MQPTTPNTYLKPEINTNIFYSCYQDRVFVCFEKVPSTEYEREYNIIRNGDIIATGFGRSLKHPDDVLTRPQQFDNDHYTELYKPDTRNWLCYEDTSFQMYNKYVYEVETVGGRHRSGKTVVVTT